MQHASDPHHGGGDPELEPRHEEIDGLEDIGDCFGAEELTDDGDGRLDLCGEGMTVLEMEIIQANSENCGTPLGNKIDLEVGQKITVKVTT